MKKIFICCEGPCIKRILDAQKISNYLYANGNKIVDSPIYADSIIFVSCGVGNHQVNNSLSIIERFKDHDAELIVAGCLPDIAPDKLRKAFNGKIFSTKNLEDIDNFFPENKIKFKEIDDANVLDGDFITGKFKEKTIFFKKLKRLNNAYIRIRKHILSNLYDRQSLIYRILSEELTKDKSMYNLRISRGCFGNCAYCSIKKAVGTHESKPFETCINEFKKGLKMGYTFFPITGDDIGGYGIDIKSNFPELLDGLTSIHGDYELLIREISPFWIVKYIDDLEKIIGRYKISHLGVALQSGSPCVLKLMNRYSDIEKIEDSITRLRRICPNLFISIHVIVGFPTETDDDFKKTLIFIKRNKINSGFIYVFSCNPGTKAELLEPKVTEKEMLKRIKYAKKFLKKSGYVVLYTKNPFSFIFDSRTRY